MSRILIIDDTPINVQILAESLKSDYEIKICTKPLEAFDLAKREPLPDLILLDVIMPDISGYELIKLLKNDPITTSIPVIFVTAKNDAQDETYGLELGAVDYITKPFQMPVVKSRIKTHLQIKEYAEDIRNQNNLHRQLIHVLCHDLRNPIGSLSSYIDIMMEDPSIINDVRNNMNHCAKNALNIIDDIYKFMSIQEKKNKLVLSNYELLPLIQESYSIVQSRLESKSIKLEINVPQGIYACLDRTTFINSVMNNLLTNAIKFSHQNSKITIFTKIDSTTKTVQLHLRDYGVGIPDKVLKNIFNIDRSQSMPGTSGEVGTGFGMPLVQKFVTSYQGKVTIETFPQETHPDNHGTDVILHLKLGQS